MIIEQRGDQTDALKGEHKLTTKLVEEIARWNGNMTAEQVRLALVNGQTIYTNLNRWVMKK